jgi:hypothetical protein
MDTMQTLRGIMSVVFSLHFVDGHLHPPDRQNTDEYHLLSCRHLQAPYAMDG